jgi:antitoxin component HigA of HigAB toxin-antitoxin module
MSGGLLQAAFALQLVLVSGSFLLAWARARSLREADAAQGLGAPGLGAPGLGTSQHASRVVTERALVDVLDHVPQLRQLQQLQHLEQERARLTHELELLRAAHADEESEFRARRRAALLEMQSHRQVTAELSAEEPGLSRRVQALRAEVEHFERRRAALSEEIVASTRTSAALNERASLARQELASIGRDRERVRRRILSDGQQLRDLAHRRALLGAETVEMAALLELYQQLADQPYALTFLSDGDPSSGAVPPGRAIEGRPAAVTADPVVTAADSQVAG